jgi:hypothetical protein
MHAVVFTAHLLNAVTQETSSAQPAGGSGSVSTSALAENLLAELSQSSTESSSHQPPAGGSSGSGNLAATAWIKKEDDDGQQNAVEESEVDIGMTAAQLLSSCKASGVCHLCVNF